MTDLHCHILPGMDDGAKDTAVSLELLRREYEDGVRNIAFTSHFNSERTTVEAFTEKRQTAFEQLPAALFVQPAVEGPVPVGKGLLHGGGVGQQEIAVPAAAVNDGGPG